MMLIGMAAGHLYLPGPAAAVTPAGTMIPSVSSVSCVMQGVAYRFDSNLVDVKVPQFYKVSIAPPGSGFAKPRHPPPSRTPSATGGTCPNVFPESCRPSRSHRHFIRSSARDQDRQLRTEVTSKWEPTKAVWFTTRTG
jgi:hypothetical protein